LQVNRAPLSLEWSHGVVVVDPLSAMIRDAVFRVGGADVRPLAAALWEDPGPHSGLPGHVRVLGGDFVCVPFGSAAVPPDADAAWNTAAAANDPPHGLSAELTWSAPQPTGDALLLTLEYPPAHPIERLERLIRGVPGQSAVEFELRVHARARHETSIGLHPILRIPDEGTLVLDVAFGSGRTYPGLLPGGHQRLLPGARFDSLATAPAVGGGVMDVSRLPLPMPTEEVIQLLDVTPPLTARTSAYVVTLDWDSDILPHVLLWISDRGIAEPPWDGHYRGFGVEPIAAAFDFPDEVSTSTNPLRVEGARTSVWLDPFSPLVVRHRISVKGTT